ncbi:hypothetical protein MAM1_0113d05617 [Mucor ambiguus]|uniref:Uncharacterized protein n=1 Tax=Mucor ambiguus TaxID=91626 RepID=A0A0C9LV46_9FUNG|nr:hypothetical protein MAM1_0113d05617 [Mucor ambiguus]
MQYIHASVYLGDEADDCANRILTAEYYRIPIFAKIREKACHNYLLAAGECCCQSDIDDILTRASLQQRRKIRAMRNIGQTIDAHPGP